MSGRGGGEEEMSKNGPSVCVCVCVVLVSPDSGGGEEFVRARRCLSFLGKGTTFDGGMGVKCAKVPTKSKMPPSPPMPRKGSPQMAHSQMQQHQVILSRSRHSMAFWLGILVLLSSKNGKCNR